MQPVLLEVNFNPDCNRLVQYHPDSFHHLFSILFLGEKLLGLVYDCKVGYDYDDRLLA